MISKASLGKPTKVVTGAPVLRRQLLQWQWATHRGSPVATKRTAPHRQRPLCLAPSSDMRELLTGRVVEVCHHGKDPGGCARGKAARGTAGWRFAMEAEIIALGYKRQGGQATMLTRRHLFAAATALAAAAAGLTAAAAEETIRIGFNVPLTGFAAADGTSARIGAELAVEQINAAGGVGGKALELVIYDDQASPKEAVPIATRLIEQDGVKMGISGSYSGPTRAAAGVFQEAGIPYISAYAVHPDITRAGDYVFRTSFVGEVQGRAGAKLIGEMLGKKRVALITLKNDFGKSLAAGFREAAGRFGIEVVSEYEYSIKDRQFGPIVAKVKADAPEAIYASGYFFTAGPLVSQLRAAGIEVPVIGQEGYDGQKFIEIAGAAAEGVLITTSLDRDSEAAEARAFIEAFEARRVTRRTWSRPRPIPRSR